MNDIDQKNNKGDQLAEDNESANTSPDTAMGGYTLQVVDVDPFSVNQGTNRIEQNEAGSHKNMNANLDNKLVNESNDTDSASVVQSVGHLLRRARIARGMSIEDISRQLRLSTQQIAAIEKEDFGKLPGRTFLRGFIRNYANLVQLDPVPLLQLLPESVPVVSTYERTPFKNSQISFSSNRKGSGSNQFVIVIILFIIILGAYFVFRDDDRNKEADKNYTETEVKIDSEIASVEIQLPLAANVRSEINSRAGKISETNNQIDKNQNPGMESDTKTETVQIENKSAVKETTNIPVTSKEMGDLHFKFTADSWIKVVDGAGVALFEQIKKSGTEQILTGKRPLSIVIGNTSGVNLTYNDTEIDVSSYRRQDGTARFTLE